MTNYTKIYDSLKSYKIEKALLTIMKIALTSKAFSYKEEVADRLKSIVFDLNRNSEDSFTDFTKIQIGLKTAEILSIEDLEEAFQLMIAIGAHEVGHIRFTCRRTFQTLVHDARRIYKKAGGVVKDANNIIEDRRIEYLIGLVDERFATAIKFMSMLVVKMHEKRMEETTYSTTMTAREKINCFLNGLVYVSHTFKAPEVKGFPEEVKERLEKAIPYLIYSYKGTSTKTGVKLTYKVIDLIQDWIDELNNDKDEEPIKTTMDDHSRSTGSYDPVEAEELEEFKEITETLSGNKDEETEEEKKFREKMEKELNGEDDFDDEEKSDEDSEGSGESDEDSGDGNSKGSGESDEDSGDETEDGDSEGSGESDEDSEDGDSKGSSKSDDGSNDETEDGESKGSGDDESDGGDSKENGDSENSKEKKESKKTQNGKNVLDMTDFFKRKSKETFKGFDKARTKVENEPLTVSELKDFTSDLKANRKSKLVEKSVFEDISKASIPEAIHNGATIKIEEYKGGRFDAIEYKQIVSEHKKIITKAVTEIQKVKVSISKKNVRNRRKGRLDVRDLTKINTKSETIYKDTIKIFDSVDLEMGILVDKSGSNTNYVTNQKTGKSLPRYMVNQEIAIVIHEIAKAANIPHFVWGFDECNRTTFIDSMIDFSDCFDNNSGTNLKGIDARGGNRDGLAIAATGQYLAKQRSNKPRKKLLIVISDGQPAGFSYSGKEAVIDVRYQIEKLKFQNLDGSKKAVSKKKVEQEAIKTIGIFSGNESENPIFTMMYENSICANGDTIFQLPDLLAQLIVKEFQK